MPARVAVSNHAAVFSQYHKVTLTDECGITHATNIPRCHFRANACGVPSNPEGAPAGGISALAYGIVQPSTSNIHPKRNDPRVVPPPAHQPSAKPHSATNSYLPNRQKTSPMSPPFPKSETNLRFLNGGDMGEVLGGCGRFGGRGSPLSRGLPLPPRSSPYPPSAS